MSDASSGGGNSGNSGSSAPNTGAPSAQSTSTQNTGSNPSSTQSTQQSTTPDAGTTPKQVASQGGEKMYEIKVDGEVLKVSESELKAGFQTRKASDKAFREGAALRKQAEEFISNMKDPGKFYDAARKLGHDPRKLAEEFLASQLENDLMDPRDRELRDAKKQLKEIEDAKAEAKRAEEAKAHAENTARLADSYSKDIIGALSTAGLPKTHHTVKRMAYYMAEGVKRGYDLSAKDVVDLVRQDYITEQKELFGQMDGDTLAQLLGEEQMNKVRKADLARLKNPQGQTPSKQAPQQNNESSKKPGVNKEDWKAKMERIKQGKE